MSKYIFPVPPSRGVSGPSAKDIKFSVLAADITHKHNEPTYNSCIRDLVIHALIARVAFTNDCTEEFHTTFDQQKNLLEIGTPQELLDQITCIEVGPKIQQYMAWLVSGLPNLRRLVQHYTIGTTGGIVAGTVKGVGLKVSSTGIIQGVDIYSTVPGDIEIDIWKTDFDGYPGSVTNSITNGNYITLSGSDKAHVDISDWNIEVEACDLLQFHVVSSSTVDLVTVTLDMLADNILGDCPIICDPNRPD